MPVTYIRRAPVGGGWGRTKTDQGLHRHGRTTQIPRNAQQCKVKAAPGVIAKQRGQGDSKKAGAPYKPRPNRPKSSYRRPTRPLSGCGPTKQEERQSNLQQRRARNTRDGASGLSLPFLFSAAAPLLLLISPTEWRNLSTNCSPTKGCRRPYRCR
jgi:hypothetical protein